MKNKFEIRGDVTAIFLHRRKENRYLEVLIDTSDLSIAQSMPLTWFAAWEPPAKTFYARNRVGIMLHRLITKCPSNLDIDHRDHNGLNDRKYNLFPSTRSSNRLNQVRVQKGTASGLRGVTWHNKKWRARVTLNGISRFLGYWDHKEDASEVVENFLLITLGKQRYREGLATA